MFEYKQDPRYDVYYRIAIQYCINYRKYSAEYNELYEAKEELNRIQETYSPNVPMWIEKCEWKRIYE